MEYVLLAVILLQFIYIVYKDYTTLKERDRLQNKLMSKDLSEYVAVSEEKPEPDTREEPDPYVPAEEATIEQILKAEDRT